jgi:hypothetical protein
VSALLAAAASAAAAEPAGAVAEPAAAADSPGQDDLDAAVDAARVAQSVVGHPLPSALLRSGDRIRD